MNHDNRGGMQSAKRIMTMERGDGRVCSNNPDHKVGMIAQRILKVPEFDLSRDIRTIEFQCPNILTYLMNVSCMVDKKKMYCPLYLVVNYAPHPPHPLCTERHAMCRFKIPSVV